MHFQEILQSPDKDSMAFFLQYPDKDSEIEFLVVNGDGTSNPFESDDDVNNLTEALAVAQIVDEQALILIDIFRDGIVKKDKVKHLGALLTALDPCEALVRSLLRATDEGRSTDEDNERLSDSIYNLNKKELIVADKDGLNVLNVRPDGSFELFMSNIPYLESAYGEDSREVKVAKAVNANAYVYQTLVSWHPTEDGTLRPNIVHPGETVTLGLETAEKFYPIASVIRDQQLRS